MQDVTTQFWKQIRPYVQNVYDRVLRPYLPRTFGVYAGVPARDKPILDATKRKPEYKEGLLTAIADEITDGDHVTLIGGGRGVSSVFIIQAGAEYLTAYEAAAKMITVAQETVEIAGVEEFVSFEHALVGPAIEVYGDYDDAKQIAPSDLQPDDVLISDCEGAEVEILNSLKKWPETIIVETHPKRGAYPNLVYDRLLEKGYNVRSLRYEPDVRPDKVVLVATDNNGQNIELE